MVFAYLAGAASVVVARIAYVHWLWYLHRQVCATRIAHARRMAQEQERRVRHILYTEQSVAAARTSALPTAPFNDHDWAEFHHFMDGGK